MTCEPPAHLQSLIVFPHSQKDVLGIHLGNWQLAIDSELGKDFNFLLKHVSGYKVATGFAFINISVCLIVLFPRTQVPFDAVYPLDVAMPSIQSSGKHVTKL